MPEYAFSVEGIGQDLSRRTHGSCPWASAPQWLLFVWRRPTFVDGVNYSHSSHMFLRGTSREVGESSLRGCPEATSQ